MREKEKEKEMMQQGHARVRRESSKMESLPDELVMDILSRIPTLELANLRYVCKRWRNIVEVKNPLFRTLHLSRSLSRPTENKLLLLKGKSDDLHFVDSTSHPIKTLHVPFLLQYDIIGSCNGLLCLLGQDRRNIRVMNPFTCQPVGLDLDMDFSSSVWLCGFGLDSVNKIYKVVVVVWNVLLRAPELRICDLCSHKNYWRPIGWNKNFEFRPVSYGPACLCNGRLHWIHGSDGAIKIISFDLSDEKLRMLPTPDCLPTPQRGVFDTFVLRECFCVSCSDASTTPTLQIWIMKEYGVKESWVKEIDTKARIPKTLPSHFGKSQKRRWPLYIEGLGSVRDGEVLLKCKRLGSEGAILFSLDSKCDQLQFLELENIPSFTGSVIHTACLTWI